MRIQRVLNNNVVVAHDAVNHECIIIGKGIGFGKKTGDIIDPSLSQKIYRHDENINLTSGQDYYSDIPESLFHIVSEIVTQAKTRLDRNIHKSVYASLLDHLNFAIERDRLGKRIKNQLLWDIKRLYREEFRIGSEAIDKINQQLGTALDENEAAFVALHLLNAQQDGTMPDVSDVSKIIQETLNIIKYHFRIEYKEDSLNFQRLVTHLKFFAHRLLSNSYVDNRDGSLNELVSMKYKQSHECAVKISDFINKNYGRKLTDDEVMFLTIHTENLRNE
ncbi:BglG family transcription antiterminator LicT [Klebsiella sp. BIGb0407]|uniref:BglG family transcription antiterminator LicT n=1 Tax=Klebsiella sp. BIGb0407 TaxID=2940603 RepID=UPI0021695CD8|nr:PRD domain-containing protein [Klebsiella sp. BIGb0407]MCS3429889.1 beta-glucoside operon transcriptional antiterminator [Klebsiella sp. BIGb0407]